MIDNLDNVGQFLWNIISSSSITSIIIRHSGINPIPPMVKDRELKETKAKEND